MSKRSRPQPITAPAPESFLPSFDFGSPVKPRSGGSKALPKRKMPDLSKRLAAFAFLNLEDIQEEVDDLHAALNASPISTAPSSKGARFWEFSKPKNSSQRVTSPSTPASLPPMSSKAYATLVGGGGTTPSSAKSTFSKNAPSKRRSSAFTLAMAELDQVVDDVSPLSPPSGENKSLAVDLVSIFSVSTGEDTDNKTRFSFPMPPSFTPRRGSQSPLDPDLSFPSMLSPNSVSPQSPESGFSDYSFFSPLFSAGFGARTFLSAEPSLPPVSEVAPMESISPLEKVDTSSMKSESRPKKARPTRPTVLVPPAPPPHDSPPPTPSSVYSQQRTNAALRACPSPDLDPELSAHSSTTSIASVVESSESENESIAPSPAPAARDLPPASTPNVFANWDIGSPSRSDSIVTITQRAFSAMRPRGSISNISGSFSTARGSVSAGSPMNRNGSWGSGEMYDWEQAIDDIYLRISRKPSIASIALAASAEGAALPTTSLDVVADTAFVMDDEMRRKLMESQYLVPTRQAPRPPSPTRSAASAATKSTTKKETASSSAASDSDWVSASATSSARSSLDEQRPSPVHSYGPSTQVKEDAPVHTMKSRPAPLVTSPSYPPVNPLRLKRPRPASTLIVPDAKVVLPLNVQSPRPPPIQSIPTSDAETSSIFSPISATSPPLLQPLDIENWPLWSSSGIDASLDRKRDVRRPSANGTMISKFSDDSVDVNTKKRTGPKTGNRVKKSSPTRMTKPALSPGSSHTSYTFLGLKRKTPASSNTNAPVSFSPKVSQEAAPRTSLESTLSGSSNESKRNGLKRPPLPLELFIRA